MKGLSDTYVESVIRAFAKGRMTARQAAAKLGITRQYANRLRKAYAEEGPPCLRHGNSGRTSPLRTDPETGGGRSTSRAQITPGDSTRSRSNQVETNNVIMTPGISPGASILFCP